MVYLAHLGHHIKKNGTCAVYIFMHLKKKLRFETGVSIKPEHWNDADQAVKGSDNDADLNMIINNCKARLNDIFVKYRLMNKCATPAIMKREYAIEGVTGDFIRFIEDVKNDQKGALSHATIQTYETLITKLKTYKKRVSFNEIDVDYILDFKKHLKTKQNNNPNTVEKTIGILKKFVRIAVRKKYIADDPFGSIKVKRLSGNRVFLDENQLMGLFGYYYASDIPENHRFVLRYFLFSCITGLRLSDIKTITKGNITGGLLILQPVKTKGIQKIVKIPLCSKALELIGNLSDKNENSRLFTTYTDQATNRMLKAIALKLTLPTDISFHSGRHTFATIFYRKTKNLAALQKLLGHYSITETMIYSHIVTDDLENEMKCFEFITPCTAPIYPIE